MLHSKGRTTCSHVQRRRVAALDKRVEPEVDSDVPFGKTWKLMSKKAKDVTEDVKSDMEADIIISELYLHGRKSPCPCTVSLFLFVFVLHHLVSESSSPLCFFTLVLVHFLV